MDSSVPMLSVTIITKNEERDLPRCLRSLWFADEIIVLDSGSTDDTLKIAHQFTDKVFEYKDWRGFGVQKNRALSHVTNNWVLSLDADEWVTNDLAQEILTTIRNANYSVYKIPRLTSFCGTTIYYCGWYPDYVARLFRVDSAKFSNALVHERLIFEQSAGKLINKLHHASYYNIEEVMDKNMRYANDGAMYRYLNGDTTSFTGALLSSLWAFLRTWIIRLGFLDGKAGFMVSVSIAEGTYYRYLRLLEISQLNKKKSVALIITTYNRPQALEQVLLSIESLDWLPNEIVIADDGSDEETRSLVEMWKRRLPLHHVWQDDCGFRAAKARNAAVKITQSEYLLFIDGDCLLGHDFVDFHMNIAENSHFVAGSRILMSKQLTQKMIEGDVFVLKWPLRRWGWAWIMRQSNRILPFFRLPDVSWRKIRQHNWRGVHTCNMGVWRKDFCKINGFDEDFQGWGHEDADLAIRLIRNGVLRKDGKFGSPVLHLWHSRNNNSVRSMHHNMLKDTIANMRPIRAMNGMYDGEHAD